jgi:GNAT superfamily N-acetyltransferase
LQFQRRITYLTSPDLGIDERSDINKAHFQEFGNTLHRAIEKYFSLYGSKQYSLWLLATHPDFRRMGAGSLLTKWGLELAARESFVATVFASPMAETFYEHLGFQILGTVVVQVEGEEEKLVLSPLAWKQD